MSGGAVGLGIAAAVCVALGSALQHQAAAAAGGDRGGIGLLRRLARSRRWMTGLAAAGVGVLLHAAALLDRVRPPAGLVAAAVVLSGGIAVFATAARPGAGAAVPDARGAAAVLAAGAALAGLCSVAAARARSGRVAGLAMGLGAGALYGLAGGVLKAVDHAVLRDPAAAVAGWPLWTLAVLGAWAFILHQRAYARAPLQASLPALSVASPLAGMAFGVLAFREVPAGGSRRGGGHGSHRRLRGGARPPRRVPWPPPPPQRARRYGCPAGRRT